MSKIVNVLRGPVHSSEVPDWDEQDDGFGYPYGEAYILYVVMQDERGVLTEEELVFEDFDEALELVDHFVDQIATIDWEDE